MTSLLAEWSTGLIAPDCISNIGSPRLNPAAARGLVELHEQPSPLELVGLPQLMQRTVGRADVAVGLIDGPVATDHPDLKGMDIKIVLGQQPGCSRSSAACAHGTFVAGVLSARRESAAPAICPGCTLFLRPIFAESSEAATQIPSATPGQLATALIETAHAGARIVNISAAIAGASTARQKRLEDALDLCRRWGVIVVAAAGNQARVGATAITGHPWVIPVVAYDRRGRPTDSSNLGKSIGRSGLGAPGDAVTSLAPPDGIVTSGGTSVAAPFVTGTIALLWSEFPWARASELRLAVVRAAGSQRHSVVPPLLDAWAAYQFMAHRQRG